MNIKKRMNIMTSCDDNYASYVLVTMVNLEHVFSKKYDVNFYLLNKLVNENIEMIKSFADTLELKFHNIPIESDDYIDQIAKYSRARGRAMYYDLAPHLYLPQDVDRCLYVDTGDVLFFDFEDECDFYFRDFEGKSLLVSRYWNVNQDKYDFLQLKGKLFGGFNSGHVLFNLEQLRKLNYQPQDYINYVEKWHAALPNETPLFVGDQPFLNAFYGGDIAVIEKNNYHNVTVRDFVDSPTIKMEFLKSVHFNGTKFKPWHVPFSTEEELYNFCFQYSNGTTREWLLNKGEAKCMAIWWDYCKMTPIYDTLKRQSYSNNVVANQMAKILRNQKFKFNKYKEEEFQAFPHSNFRVIQPSKFPKDFEEADKMLMAWKGVAVFDGLYCRDSLSHGTFKYFLYIATMPDFEILVDPVYPGFAFVSRRQNSKMLPLSKQEIDRVKADDFKDNLAKYFKIIDTSQAYELLMSFKPDLYA